MNDDLESAARANKKLLKREYVEPVVRGPATLVTMFELIPATVVLVEARRCFIQADEVLEDGTFSRNMTGRLYLFNRRKNAKVWKYGNTDAERSTMSFIAGVKLHRRVEL